MKSILSAFLSRQISGTMIAAAFFATCAPVEALPAYDVIIKNARIIDGTGAAWYRGDLAILDEKIAAVGRLDSRATAPLVIDAADRYVAPGFIDVHTHCEGDFEDHPAAENFLRMGVTTVVTGNCGFSRVDIGDSLTSLTAFDLGPNVATLIGHNSVRRRAMGNANRDPSTTELLEMASLVRQGMADGAIGLSTGLIYTPGTYSKTPEIVALAREAARAGGIYVSHMRSESSKIMDAIEEALEIGRKANIPVHISHFKVSSIKRHGQSTVTIGMIESARKAGQDVTVDQYAYTASSTSLSAMMPNDSVAGSRLDVHARLTNPTSRSLIKKQLVSDFKDGGRKNLDYAHIANFNADRSLNGKSLYEITKMWMEDDSWESQAEVVLDLMTSGGAGMVYHTMSEGDVENIMRYPNTMVASDSGVRMIGKGKPHPRGYGNNARILGFYTRDKHVLRLEDAIRKMTSLPARTMRMDKRGILRPGMAADIVVFDLEKVNDPATFENPHAYAEGFDYVFVNGHPVINNGILTDDRGGKVIYGAGKTQ